MADLTVNVRPFDGSPRYDLHILVNTDKQEEAECVEGKLYNKDVTIQLALTDENKRTCFIIQEMRGDLEVEIPRGWRCETDANYYMSGSGRLPRLYVTSTAGQYMESAGYITTPQVRVILKSK